MGLLGGTGGGSSSGSSFNAAAPGEIGGTTPAAITGTTITATTQFNVGASDVVVNRYAAKQLMISGDGVGATTNAGMIFGYTGFSGYGGIWSSTVTPGTSNYALMQGGSGETMINSGANQNTEFRVAGTVVKGGVAATAGAGFYITAGTAVSDVNALSVTRTNNNAAVTKGVEFSFTATTQAAQGTYKHFSILGGAAGATPQFAVYAGSIFGSGSAANEGAFRSNGGVAEAVLADATAYAPFNALHYLIGGVSDTNLSRISAGLIGIGTGASASFAGSLKLTNMEAVGTMGIRALTTLTDGADGTNTNNYKFVSFVSNSAEAGNVIRVGTTSAVVFTTTSSREFKNILGDSNREAASDRIMAYRMRNYEWKSQPGMLFDGPIAEEAYAVNPDPMLFPGGEKSINMSGFIPDLIMAVQELKAEVERLKASH